MSKLNFEYVPLTFINDKEEIKKQVRNTLILIYLFEKYNNPVRLETLIEGTQYGFNASALQSGKNKFLRISDIYESKVDWETVPYCNCDDEKTYLLKDEDILIARTGGTTGKSFKIHNPPKRSIYAGYLIRIRAKTEVNPDYIYLFLHCFAYWSQIVNLNERNFRPKANAENLKALILPDCPKEIQDEVVRIAEGENVKGYEDLFAEIKNALSEYDKAREVEELLSEQLTQLENLNQAILQEAVQGKLVKQDKKDEPASELLKRIKEEKTKSGKKEKELPPIKPEEIPFEIPKSWVWCRIGEVLYSTSGGTPDRGNATYWNGKISWLKSGELNDDFIINDSQEKITQDGLKNSSAKLFPAGTLLIALYGATAGRLGILTFQSTTNQAVCGFFENEFVETKYLFYYLWSSRSKIIEDSWGQAQPNISQTYLKDFLLPLPPLPEQKRIVAEIEKQLAKTKQLKEHIIANQQATDQLLKALLHQAFEVKETQQV